MKAKRSALSLVLASNGPARPSKRSSPVVTHDLVNLKPRMVPYTAIDTLADRLQIPTSDLWTTLGIPARTAARRKQQGYLTVGEADRLLRVAGVFEDAARIFGGTEKAGRWLSTPHPLFGNATPLSWLDSHAGAHAVSEELVRIDFGDLA